MFQVTQFLRNNNILETSVIESDESFPLGFCWVFTYGGAAPLLWCLMETQISSPFATLVTLYSWVRAKLHFANESNTPFSFLCFHFPSLFFFFLLFHA